MTTTGKLFKHVWMAECLQKNVPKCQSRRFTTQLHLRIIITMDQSTMSYMLHVCSVCSRRPSEKSQMWTSFDRREKCLAQSEVDSSESDVSSLRVTFSNYSSLNVAALNRLVTLFSRQKQTWRITSLHSHILSFSCSFDLFLSCFFFLFLFFLVTIMSLERNRKPSLAFLKVLFQWN